MGRRARVGLRECVSLTAGRHGAIETRASFQFHTVGALGMQFGHAPVCSGHCHPTPRLKGFASVLFVGISHRRGAAAFVHHWWCACANATCHHRDRPPRSRLDHRIRIRSSTGGRRDPTLRRTCAVPLLAYGRDPWVRGGSVMKPQIRNVSLRQHDVEFGQAERAERGPAAAPCARVLSFETWVRTSTAPDSREVLTCHHDCPCTNDTKC